MLLNTTPDGFTDGPGADAIAASLAFLDSDAARAAIDDDPYWPKWDGPWWHIVALHELGLAASIPRATLLHMAHAIDRHYLHTFPLTSEDVPPGLDPYVHALCHCALGAMTGALRAGGLDVDALLPWARPWFLTYTLPDGGLNCEEVVYAQPHPHSSVASTLPPAEAVLAFPDPSAAELAFLRGVADYLNARRLAWRATDPTRLMDPAFLHPRIPRFYDYDLLRGLRFLVACARRPDLNIPLQADTARAALDVLDPFFLSAPAPPPGRHTMTRRRDAAGAWQRTSTGSSPLLDLLFGTALGMSVLHAQWSAVRDEVVAAANN